MNDQLKMDPGRQGQKTCPSGSAPCLTGGSPETDPNKRYVDITAMIRSLQRTEGVADCFRRDVTNCDRMECAWRKYCLGSAKDVLMENNE